MLKLTDKDLLAVSGGSKKDYRAGYAFGKLMSGVATLGRSFL
ncbi:hypothetical protein [Fructobacillus papyriferae]|nr:hypothetical protein [Fructobacillus papyriferae]